ncbi:MAG: hypothetical protein LLF94_08170 [Chlamydiales bacterium]|nr:hypothetical protein [Chlamydiales bacterium]
MYFLFFIFFFQSLNAQIPFEEWKENGYVELCNTTHNANTFDMLYARFDELTDFLQNNKAFAQKLYIAKERFIRTKERNYYSSDFFGFYDESEKPDRCQISFYYSTHFHDFVASQYPDLLKPNKILNFFDECRTIQEPYLQIFNEALAELHPYQPSLLFKVIKYFPSYRASHPHYDGGLLSLFLNSTDNESLLLSPYKSSLSVDDFICPQRQCPNSLLLIPGVLLTEFSIYPTPHIVTQSGKIRYATVAFAMQPHYTPKKIPFTHLPNFKIE